MNSLANLLKPFLLGFVLNFLKFKGPNQTFSFRIFRVLHTVQSLIFKVLCCSLSQTAHIFYHKLFCLSRTFLNFFEKVFSVWSSFAPAGINYITVISVCQQLFIIIFFRCPKGKKIIIWKEEAEKEGFEPSRRFPDLHP